MVVVVVMVIIVITIPPPFKAWIRIEFPNYQEVRKWVQRLESHQFKARQMKTLVDLVFLVTLQILVEVEAVALSL